MNLILLTRSDFIDEDRVLLTDRRAAHVLTVLRSQPGDQLQVGVLNGPLGTGLVSAVNEGGVHLEVTLDRPSPRPRVDVVLAMVRPQAMKRTLVHLATLGVRRILLTGARRVEKAYFEQRLFDGKEYEEYLMLGLEQARDTWLPEVTIHRRFRPFVEDLLPTLLEGTSQRYVAHPGGGEPPCPVPPDEPVALAIGPEGGWSDFEVAAFQRAGFLPLSLGPRILKVETAVPYLFGRLGL